MTLETLNTLFFYLILVIFGIVLIVQIFKRNRLAKLIRSFFWVSAFFTLAYVSYLTYLQYIAFKSGPLGLTIGTVKGLTWFLGYVRFHFWNQYLVSFLIALLVFWIAQYFNRKRGEIFFEREETYLAALGIFLAGYPAWLFYIVLVLVTSVITSSIFMRKGERLPLYYFWMPTAIFVIITVNLWASHTDWWASLRF